MAGVSGRPVVGVPRPGRYRSPHAVANRWPRGIEDRLIGAAGELDSDGRVTDGRHVPEPGGRVGADGQHARPVRREPGTHAVARRDRAGGESGSPVSASQTRAAPSKPAVAIRAPSGLKQASRTAIAWLHRARCRSDRPACSCVPDAGGAVITGGDHPFAVGAEFGMKDPIDRVSCSGVTAVPVVTSHTRAVPSWLAISKRVPSGLKQTSLTVALSSSLFPKPQALLTDLPERGVCRRPRRWRPSGSVGADRPCKDVGIQPQGRAEDVPRSASQRQTVLLDPAETMRRPSGLKRASRTGEPWVSQPAAGRSAIGGVPDPDRAIVGRGKEGADPSLLKLDPVNRSIVGQGGRDGRACGDVPDPGGVIGRGGGEPPARTIERRPRESSCHE